MVRIRPECPEGNLRELMWHSNPNCGIAREREKKRERERTIPAKSPNLRHCWAHSQNKGLSEYQRRASRLRTGPFPAGGREVGGWQPELERGNLGPRNAILYQTTSRLPASNQDFLGFWTADIRREGCSQRSAAQKRHTWGSVTAEHPGNWAAGTGEAIRRTVPGESALAKYLVTWAARTWEGHKTQAQTSLHLCGVPENLNLSDLDLGCAHNPGPALDSSPAEQPGAWAV